MRRVIQRCHISMKGDK